MLNALDIHVQGIVQGVGFRPFVYRLAKRYLVNGWVLNALDGVHIHAEGEEKLVDEFVLEMHNNPPAAAKIARIDMVEVPFEGFEGFEIRFSDADETEETTYVSPDLATCDDCLAELFDPNNRRYHYPFINCTNCGPRFTIIDGLPYDRPRTSMADFAMCDACAAEYADPADRRFHAQPDACFTCGPLVYSAVLTNSGIVDAAASPGTQSAFVPSGSPTEVGFAPTNETISGTSETLADFSTAREFTVKWGKTQEESDAIVAQVVDALRAGKIVAVKGLGGFQLMCDAFNEAALAELRTRKKRDRKAFAVLVQDVAVAREYCEVSHEEEALLVSPARPIVLLKKRADVTFAAELADHLPELGVMLPATPLQHLMVRAFGGMLVCTSGNVHDEPIQIDDEEACVALAGIADVLVGNNRPIRSRYDDSVVRVLDFGTGETAIQFIRRARGYCPIPLSVGVSQSAEVSQEASATPRSAVQNPAAQDSSCASLLHASNEIAAQSEEVSVQRVASASCDTSVAPTIFATGPEQKNTFCFLQGEKAFVSQHIGDMENVPTNDAWLEAKQAHEHLFELTPTHVACDLHPEYLTSKWASQLPLPTTAVQHHHAHIVSAMAENRLEGPVCGIAFDGTGYGADGAIWGGEVLLANCSAFERFANFAYFPLPGGAAAIKHPLRAAYGALWALDLLEHPAASRVLDALGDEAAVCERMIEAGLNTPYTSSVGRLFDAAAAILGICTAPTYEGEPAVLFSAVLTNSGNVDAAVSPGTQSASVPSGSPTEVGFAPTNETTLGTSETLADSSTAREASRSSYVIDIVKNTATENSTAQDTSVVLLDAAPLFNAMLDDVETGTDISLIAKRFHDAIVDAIVHVAQLVEAAYDIRTVVLSGGVFMNRYLTEHAVRALADAGFMVAMNKELPPNDGCISLGQAVVAAHSL